MILTRPGADVAISGGRPNLCPKISFKRHHDCSKFGRLYLGQRIGGEDTCTQLTSGEILQPPGHPIGRVELDVDVRFRMWLSICGRLMDDHHIRKWSRPQRVVLQQDRLQGPCKLPSLVFLEPGQRGRRASRCDPDLVWVSGAYRHERHDLRAFEYQAASVLDLCAN